MYRLGKHLKRTRRKRAIWLAFLLLISILTFVIIKNLQTHLKPQATITKTTPRVSKVTYDTTIKHYEEKDFSLDLPTAWQPIPRPPGPYQTYAWQTSQAGSKGQTITVYQDTIPTNFAVNRILIVEAQVDHLQLVGSPSDNCASFTRGLTPLAGQIGVPAKWQSVNFLCDQFNTQRDVIGTTAASSAPNTVELKSPTTGQTHTFFFTYTNQATDPDPSTFLAALQSFKMQ